MTQSKLPAKFLADRDAQIFSLRKTGLPATDIARRLELSTSQVNAAISRQLTKLNKESFLAYPEVLRMELERLDAMQAALWPQTQIRRVTMEDGTEVTLEPDIKATSEIRNIMAHRSRLLGMDVAKLEIDDARDSQADIRSSLEGAVAGPQSQSNRIEAEAKELLELAMEAGIIDEAVAKAMLRQEALTAGTEDDIVDAEIIEDTETEDVVS
jgi:hypothetical protein